MSIFPKLVAKLCLILLLYQPVCPAQAAVKKNYTHGCQFRLLWSASNTEISSAAFTPDGKEILFCRKFHIPDGAEAESYTESELATLLTHNKKNSRWADPEIVGIFLKDGSLERFDYGYDPLGSKDGRKVYYIHQTKPVGRLRAGPIEGNEVSVFDRATRSTSAVVRPGSGYLDKLMLSPDGRQLAYALSGAGIWQSANGYSFGVPVGIGIVDLSSGTKSIFVPPTKHNGLFDYISDMFWSGDQLIAVRKIARTGGIISEDRLAGRTYRDPSHDVEVINVSNGIKQIYKSSKIIAPGAKIRLEAFPNDDHTITIVDNESWIVDPHTGKIIKLRESPPPKGMFSPNHTRCVRRKGRILEVLDLKAGKVICHLDAPEPPFGSGCLKPKIAWSTDSSKLAIIIDASGKGLYVFDRSKLLMLDFGHE